MILTFNLFNNGDEDTNCKLLKKHACRENNHTRGHNRKLSKESYSLNIREYSFSQRIVNTWNALPPYIINAKDTDTFKRLFDTHMSCHMLVYDEWVKCTVYICFNYVFWLIKDAHIFVKCMHTICIYTLWKHEITLTNTLSCIKYGLTN